MTVASHRHTLRDGTAAAWASINPILALSEIGYATDTGELKFGDGTTAWNDLPNFIESLANLDNRYTVRLAAAKDGTVDIGPIVQDMLDDGLAQLILDKDGTYLWDTPVFDDAPGTTHQFHIHTNGATILLGPNLPTVAEASSGNEATRFALIVNIKRAALSGGVVTVTGNQNAGSTKPRVLAHGGCIDGQDDDRGFIFGSLAGVHFNGTTLYQGKTLIDWFDYTDGVELHHCFNTAPVDGSYLVSSDENGDGLVVSGCVSASGGGIAKRQFCAGGVIDSSVGGRHTLTSCRAMQVRSAHVEMDQAGRPGPGFLIDRSDVDFLDTVFFAGIDYPPIEINDLASSAESRSTVLLRGCVFRDYLRGDANDNAAKQPDILITNLNDSSRLIVEHSSGAVTPDGSTLWLRSGMYAHSPVAAIQTALDNARSLIASGSWELRKRAGVWEVVVPQTRGLVVTRPLSTPTLSSVTATSEATGDLTNGTIYAYAMALLDSQGRYSQATAEVSVAAGSSGAIRLLGTITTSPCQVVIWRKAGTGVLSAPDAYVVMPYDGYRFRFYDTGDHCNRIPWIATSVPVPNTVAASDHTASQLVLDGGSVFPPLRVIATTDSAAAQGLSNTTPVDDDTLKLLNVPANSVHIVSGLVAWTAGAGKFKAQFGAPSGATFALTVQGLASTVSAATSGDLETAFVTTTAGVSLGAAGLSTPVAARITGTLRIADAAGTFKFRWAQATSSTDQTTRLAGSFLTLDRVS